MRTQSGARTDAKKLAFLESQLKRVNFAHRQYRQTVEQHQRMVEEMDGVEPADGAFAISRAKKAIAASLRELVDEVQLCSDVALGKIPPPPFEDEEHPS
jgi:hypothetical protein